MHGTRRAVAVEKTWKIWRATRAQRFECYCREFETDMRDSIYHLHCPDVPRKHSQPSQATSRV